MTRAEAWVRFVDVAMEEPDALGLKDALTFADTMLVEFDKRFGTPNYHPPGKHGHSVECHGWIYTGPCAGQDCAMTDKTKP